MSRYLFLSDEDIKKHKLNTDNKILKKFITMAIIAEYKPEGLIPHVHTVQGADGYPDDGLIMEVIPTAFVAEPSTPQDELPCSLV